MERLDPNTIAEAILAAPGWARVGITAPSASLRLDAALELAKAITTQNEAPSPPSEEQIRLAL